ncbi:MAG TPA: C40 family peptidase [Burkholderiales bacterium]|jgi:cell wall-associated NlpC family hydrolase|nr:C40 family peptidase [Burkholderiales bacterium]
MRGVAAIFLGFMVAGCASNPVAPVTDPGSADRAAGSALKMVGKPYRYGGASPAGFDCSGLVQYSYKQAGVSLPRATDAQLRISQPLRGQHLRRGDLLFFDQEGKKKSHVGIYLGDGRFVHAPSSGKIVRTDRLDSAFWKKHLSEVRRI